MKKCCVCGGVVADGEGYESLGYIFHERCLPKFPLKDKTRCYYCHKIMRKGDMVTALDDLGQGSSRDLACEKCIRKHYGRGNDKPNKKVGGGVRHMPEGTEACAGDTYISCED